MRQDVPGFGKGGGGGGCGGCADREGGDEVAGLVEAEDQAGADETGGQQRGEALGAAWFVPAEGEGKFAFETGGQQVGQGRIIRRAEPLRRELHDIN